MPPAHCNLQQEEAENSAPPLDPPHCREVAVRCDMCREWRGHEGKENHGLHGGLPLSRPFTCLSLTAM